MSGQSGGCRVHLSKLNEQLTCKLCGGYFIDATTIIECLHSFCKSCIVKYLENNKYCPICEVQVHKSRPLLNIRPDHTLQDIVYKLVPGCYQNEMRCRREFYAKHPEICSQVTSLEARGEPIESHIYSPDESLSLSLEYFNPHAKDLNETDTAYKPFSRRYLRCPAAVTVFHLQKLIRAKYGLSDAHKVDIMYKEEPLCSNYTLMDVMYIYQWRRKVPLHLSYRIFESSSKRMKLSENNANYKKSLINAGIHSIETKDEKSLRREWKEVQLKISETGVMSITDISNTILKKNIEIEDMQNQKISEETVTSIVTVNKTDSLENCISKSCVEAIQSTLMIDAQLMKNSIFPDSHNASLVTGNAKFMDENLSTDNCTSLATHHNGNITTRQTNEIVDAALTNLQRDTQEIKDNNQINNEDKSVLQRQETTNQAVTQFIRDNVPENMAKTDICAKNLSTNNNIINTDLTQKECTKSTNEVKVGNMGSKIDALSVKLQFQPKISQVNNTYSKKASKEKRAIFQNMKKSEIKLTESTKVIDTNVQTTCGNITNKVSVPCSMEISTQNPIVSSVVTSNTLMDSLSESGKEILHEKDKQSTNIDVQQALKLLEQKANLPVQTLIEPVSKISHVNTTLNQRLQCMKSNSTVTSNENIPTVSNASISTMSQTMSTFSYTVHDLVTNTAVKPTLKNMNSSCILQKSSETLPTTCSISNSQISPIPQFSMQTSSMSIFPVPTSSKNNYINVNQGITTVMATSMTTATSTSKSTSTPCPDAIPISLMKSSTRKQEMTAKGSNLNEICAKIGSNTIGSKINDICAKIGENSKEKNKIETRNKSDIPDLLKISKKNSSSLSNSDTTVKHIPNIPNIPVYTPSNITTTENKSMKIAPPTSISATLAVSASHVVQRISSFKRQSQPIGYKTLRDPPKSWNPTLSKNNYVAVKNQAKEIQNQTQTSASEGMSKQISSKPAKIFKMRNMPRYLGNPASGVKPMYGVANETKEKEQSTTNTKTTTTLNMMKIDPKTLSPIVSTVNSPIVSSSYSSNTRNYQNTPFPRDVCRNTGSPLSPRNSPVNMLSTNPFIPSPTPNTNPRIIYSHFPPFSDPSNRFPNPLIRSPIGIPPPSAFHSSLPPSINKLYQRSNYIPQTTSYSPVVSQPPTVQRVPPSTHSSSHSPSPKSPKASSPSSISSTTFNIGKVESQSSITSTDNIALLLSKNLPVAISSQQELNVFNLSKTSCLTDVTSNIVKTSIADINDTTEAQNSKQNSSSMSFSAATTSVKISENTSSLKNTERKQCKDAQKESIRCKEENNQGFKIKITETEHNTEIVDIANPNDKEKSQLTEINGNITLQHSENEKLKEGSNNEAVILVGMNERDGQVEENSSRERNNIPKDNVQININDSTSMENPKNEDFDKINEQTQSKKSEIQKNKTEI